MDKENNMRNELNNIIIEGCISEPVKGANGSVSFFLSNERDKGTIEVPIVCYGELAKKILENLHAYMTVRVVGRLAVVNRVISIIINHVEYRVSELKTLNTNEEDDEYV